uniref:Uncharacterized protein n=1 Tax=Romanomermis culicivorax TaxID=13658 RepID=A0A915I8L8_ROMCU
DGCLNIKCFVCSDDGHYCFLCLLAHSTANSFSFNVQLLKDVPSQLDPITLCLVVLVNAKQTPAFLDTGCPWTIISQPLHKALIKESWKWAMTFQQHHNFNPLLNINGLSLKCNVVRLDIHLDPSSGGNIGQKPIQMNNI